MSMLVGLVSLLPVLGVMPVPTEAGRPSVRVDYTLADADGLPRPLDRNALLFGRVVFRARPPEGSPYTLRGLRIEADAHAAVLCRSARATPESCTIDFGPEVRRRNLIFRASLTRRSTGETVERKWPVSTLRAEPDSSAGSFAAEHVVETSHPPDHVMRAVRVSRVEGPRARRRRIPVTDLAASDFTATSDAGPVEITAVRAPDPRAPCTIVLAWSVSSHLRRRGGATVWSDDHAGLVHQIRRQFEAAARNGLDCDCLVAEYAETPRPLYGPFRLHGGNALPEGRLSANRRVLDGLVAHLLADPPADWGRLSSSARRPAWESDFLSVYSTLNDLLRGTAGLAHVLVLTDGSDAPTRREPQLQARLWPARIAALNENWSGARVGRLLAELDAATTQIDQRLSEFAATLDPADSDVGLKIAAERDRLDPGGLASLQTHRRNVFPNVDVLLLPGRTGYADNLERYLPLRHGRTWRLITRPDDAAKNVHPAPDETDGELTLAEALLAARRAIRTSYVVELLVANPRQDAKGHALRIDVRPRQDRPHDRLDVDFVSAYRSSVPLAQKMPVYAGSPFKQLRLLAAYAFRERAFDDDQRALLEQRLEVEWDGQVRALLFESWISVQFQRLQAGAAQIRGTRARRRCVAQAASALSDLDPASAPDPDLATEARAVAAAWLRFHGA